MRKYENETQGQLVQVICNGCGKKLQLENDYLKEGYFTADVVFGYFSRKDGERHRFDLCEDCYDRMAAGFVIPVEAEEQSELL